MNRDEIIATIIGIAIGMCLGLLSVGITKLIITKCDKFKEIKRNITRRT